MSDNKAWLFLMGTLAIIRMFESSGFYCINDSLLGMAVRKYIHFTATFNKNSINVSAAYSYQNDLSFQHILIKNQALIEFPSTFTIYHYKRILICYKAPDFKGFFFSDNTGLYKVFYANEIYQFYVN